MDTNTFSIFVKLLLDFFSKSSGEFLAAMAGAFFGAASAYYFENSKEKKKKEAEEHGAIVRAQMALLSQLNTVRNIQKQHLDTFKVDPQREMKLIQFRMTDSDLRVAYDSISFLLMTKNPNLVPEILAAEHTYISAMECLQWRNEAYLQLHKKSELQEMDSQGKCILRVTDPRDVKLLKDLTDALYTSMENARQRLELQIEELFKMGKSIYPKKNFLKIAGEK